MSTSRASGKRMVHEKQANARELSLLRARRDRPRRRASQQGEDHPPSHEHLPRKRTYSGRE